jgi:hypothetical protein
LKVTPPAPSTDTATYKISGNYFNAAIGNSANTLKVEYRYKINNGEYSAWTAATATVSGNTYSATGTISPLSYQDTTTLQVRATDLILKNITVTKTIKTAPIFDWGSEDFKFNVPVRFNSGGNGIYGTNLEGEMVAALQPCNGNGNCVLGYGQYTKETGATNIYGTDVNVLTHTDFTVNDGNTVYSLLGLVKAVSSAYTPTISIQTGTNYTNATINAALVGNNLRFYYYVDAVTSAGAGNATNELIATVTVNHGGRIKDFYSVSFISGATGGVAAFYTSNITKIDANRFSFDIMVAATANGFTASSGYFTCPVTLNLSAYV